MSILAVIATGLVAAFMLGCASEGSRVIPPKPGPGFPDSASFYPTEALQNRQEGATTVHVCVTAHGKLATPPRSPSHREIPLWMPQRFSLQLRAADPTWPLRTMGSPPTAAVTSE